MTKFMRASGRALTAAERTEEAVAAFRTILDEYAATPSRSEAAVRLSELVPGAYSDGPDGL